MGETVCFTFLVAPGADAAKAVEIAIAVVGFVVVILRLMSRIFITKKLGWDDYLIILTAVSLFGGIQNLHPTLSATRLINTIVIFDPIHRPVLSEYDFPPSQQHTQDTADHL